MAVSGDADFGVALGLQTVDPGASLFGGPRVITNAAGHTLTMNWDDSSISSLNVTAVPEAGTGGLLAIGLAGLALRRRRHNA